MNSLNEYRLYSKNSFTIKDCFEKIEQNLITLDHLLIQMIIPWTLGTNLKLNENDFNKDYQDFQDAYNELIRFCKAILFNLKKVNFLEGTISHTTVRYSKVLDRRVAETIETCEELITYPDGISEQELQTIKNAFFAYIICVKSLNDLIKTYNQTNPKYPMIELKNIPKKYSSFSENPITIIDFIQKYDTFEKVVEYCENNN